MKEKIKEILSNFINELLKQGVEHVFSGEGGEKVSAEPKEIPQVTVKSLTEEESLPVTPIVADVEPKKRIFQIAPGWFYARNIVMTTFCNKEDFSGEVYQLGSNSKLGKVYRGKMKGVRGISLPYKINNNLICYVVNPKNGKMSGYSQVDVGPGWVDDNWWKTGKNPKNEKGYDYLGDKSAKAGVDAFPQVMEDLGFCSFEDAYEKGYSCVVDLMIYDPTIPTGSKVKGNEIPSSDSRRWVKDLPDTGSEYFSWNELLRGWNRSERPSDTQINNLLALVKTVLHPCRVAVGPIRIGSALRDPETNKKVGGRQGSLHMDGRAADLIPVNISCTQVHEWIKKNINSVIRENVLEDVGTSNEHCHVAGPIKTGESNNTRIKE
jgi:hypothetical protein